jgi:hypothetical protein
MPEPMRGARRAIAALLAAVGWFALMLSYNDAWMLLLLSFLVVAPAIFLLGKTRGRACAAVDAH